MNNQAIFVVINLAALVIAALVCFIISRQRKVNSLIESLSAKDDEVKMVRELKERAEGWAKEWKNRATLEDSKWSLYHLSGEASAGYGYASNICGTQPITLSIPKKKKARK